MDLKFLSTLSALSITLLVSGCATITHGTQETITLTTSPNGAYCALSNSKGQWTVLETPAKVTIQRAPGNFTIMCKKKGYRTTIVNIKAGLDKMMMANVIMPGSLITGAVDLKNGAAYAVPSVINIPLRKY